MIGETKTMKVNPNARREASLSLAMLRPLAFVLLMLCGIAGQGKAHAQRSTVLLLHGDAALSDLHREAGKGAERALISLGQSLLSPTMLKKRLKAASLDQCKRLSCAKQAPQHLEVDWVAAVSLWPENGSQGPSQVVLTLMNREGKEYTAKEAIRAAGIESAAQGATIEAFEVLTQKAEPQLQILGSPAGARVVIDDTPVGVLPFQGTIKAGDHKVEVRLAGYHPQHIPLKVSPRSAQPILLDVQLRSDGSLPVAAPEGQSDRKEVRKAHPWANWALAGGLAAIAVGTLVPALRSAANSGEPRGEPDAFGNYQERVEFGTASRVLLATGIVAGVGAVVVAAVRPIRMRVSPSLSSIGLQLRGEF